MLTTKNICGNCRVSPRDGLSLISSPYEVSTGIWQVLYEADNPHWRLLLSWNILSAIVHQNERCALLDDLCHCVIKLIISLNSLVVLAVFSKNLSVPVFVWLVGREKSSISVIYWQNTALPHFSVFKLCCSRWHHYEGTDRPQCSGILCPLFQLGVQGSGGHICMTPRLYFFITITAHSWGSTRVCAEPILFSGIALATQLGSKWSMNCFCPVFACCGCSTAGIQTSLPWLFSTYHISMKA